MTFVDAAGMTMKEGRYRKELFRFDRIHLNRKGQLLWLEEYIRPALKEAVREDAGSFRKE